MSAEDSLSENLYIGKMRVVEDFFMSESDIMSHAYMEAEDNYRGLIWLKEAGLDCFISQLADSEKTEDDEWNEGIYVLPWEGKE